MTKRTAAASAASQRQQPSRLTRQQAKATGVTVATSFATPPDKRVRRRVAPSKKKADETALPSPLVSSGGEFSEMASEAGAGDLSNLSSDQLVALVMELRADKERLAAELQLQREISAQNTAELEEARKMLADVPQAKEPKSPEIQQIRKPSPPRHSLLSRIFRPLTGVLSPLTTRKRPIEEVVPASEPVVRTLDLGASATRPYKRLRLQNPSTTTATTTTTTQTIPHLETPLEPKTSNHPLVQVEDINMSDNQVAPTEASSETPPNSEILLDTLFAPHKLPESIRGIRIDRSTGKLINSMMPLRRRRIRDEMERQYTLWDQRYQEHLQIEDDRTRSVREATQIAYNLVLAKWPDSNVNKIREENCVYRKPGSFNATIPKAYDNSRAPEQLRPQLPDMPQPRTIFALEHPELETPTTKTSTPAISASKTPTLKTLTADNLSQETGRSPGRTFAFPYEDLDESSMLGGKVTEEERRRSVGRTFRCPSSPLSSTDDEDEPVDTTMRDISMNTLSNDDDTITSPTPRKSNETQKPNPLHVDHPVMTDEALMLKQRAVVLRAEYEEFIVQRQRNREAQGIVATTADERNRFLLLDNNAWADLMDSRRRERLEREQEKRVTEFHPWGYADMIAQQKKERMAQEKFKDKKSSDEELARLFELAKKREKVALYGEESLEPSPATGSGPWQFGRTDASSQAEAQGSPRSKSLPPFNQTIGTGPWLFSEPGVRTTTIDIVDVYGVASTKKSAELGQQPPQGKPLEGFRPDQQSQSNLMNPSALKTVGPSNSGQLGLQATASAQPDVSIQTPGQTPKPHHQLNGKQQPQASQPGQQSPQHLASLPATTGTGLLSSSRTPVHAPAEAVPQQQVPAEPDSTIPPPSPTPKHAQLPVQPPAAIDEATDTADWQKTQLERKMRDLDRYKPKAASRLRNVSRLSSSPALAQFSPIHNLETYDDDSDRFDSPTGSANSLILQQPVGGFPRGSKIPFSEEDIDEEVSPKRQVLEELITPLSYGNLTTEEENEVRLNIHNQGHEKDNFIRDAHGGVEAFKQWSKSLFPNTLLQTPGPTLCTPEEQRKVDEFIKLQHNANPSFIKDAHGGREDFLNFTNTLFPGTHEALTTTN